MALIYAYSIAIGAFGLKIWEMIQGQIHPHSILNSYNCEHQFSTEVISSDPLMIYINEFLSSDEIDHLLNIGNNFTYTPGRDLSQQRQLNKHRTSSYFVIEGDQEDHVASCIRARAEKFLGFLPATGIESLQIVRYLPYEHHMLHTDAVEDVKPDEDGLTCRRMASFFVFLGDDCEGGETYFPNMPTAPRWSDETKFSWYENNEEVEEGMGLYVKPRKGNSLFWMNYHANNTIDDRTIHAGVTLKEGFKYGMNILVESCI